MEKINRLALKSIRQHLQLSQSDIALMSGLSLPTIRSIESDPEYNPTLDSLYSLCRAYEIDVREVLEFPRFLNTNTQNVKAFVARSHLIEAGVPRGTGQTPGIVTNED